MNGSTTSSGSSHFNPVRAVASRGSSAQVGATCSSVTPSENDDEGIGSSLADLDSLTDLLPMMAPDLVIVKIIMAFSFEQRTLGYLIQKRR